MADRDSKVLSALQRVSEEDWSRLRNVARKAAREGRWADAARGLREALEAARSEPSATHAILYNALADACRRQHDLEGAVDAARAGLEARRESGVGPVLVGNDLLMLTLALDDAGRVTEALAAAREGLAAYRAGFGEDHGEVRYVASVVARLEARTRLP